MNNIDKNIDIKLLWMNINAYIVGIASRLFDRKLLPGIWFPVKVRILLTKGMQRSPAGRERGGGAETQAGTGGQGCQEQEYDCARRAEHAGRDEQICEDTPAL
jgi:hypothetical protein